MQMSNFENVLFKFSQILIYFVILVGCQTKNPDISETSQQTNTYQTDKKVFDENYNDNNSSVNKDVYGSKSPQYKKLEGVKKELFVNNFENEDDGFTMSFVGDILLGDRVGKAIEDIDIKSVIPDAIKNISSSDISMANLEAPFSITGTAEKNKQYTFRANPESVKVLNDMGIDIVSIANNHILDFGADSFYETLEVLTQNNILFSGGGMNYVEAHTPIIVNARNQKIAIISTSRVIPTVGWYAQIDRLGVSGCYDPSAVISEIKKVKDKVDVVIVYVHWGNEKSGYPEDKQKKLAYSLVDSGANVVIGSHPHVLQGIEYYKNALIAYSLGNFIFTDNIKDTMILKLALKNKGRISARIFPYRIENFFPSEIQNQKELDVFYANINKLSPSQIITSNGVLKHDIILQK